MDMQTINIPQEKYFYVSDGTVIRNLAELPDALRKMNPDTFGSHVNAQKNDFYNWVKDVFANPKLARKIKNDKQKETMAKHVFIEVHA